MMSRRCENRTPGGQVRNENTDRQDSWGEHVRGLTAAVAH